MDTVTVKFFASLKEELGIDCDIVKIAEDITVADVWQQLVKQPVAEHILCAVNHEYTTWDCRIRAGDEIAFFPPVSGG